MVYNDNGKFYAKQTKNGLKLFLDFYEVKNLERKGLKNKVNINFI